MIKGGKSVRNLEFLLFIVNEVIKKCGGIALVKNYVKGNIKENNFILVLLRGEELYSLFQCKYLASCTKPLS